ncbi:MAG: hypothetical protein ACLU6F_08410 [[Ruminococcus] torques]
MKKLNEILSGYGREHLHLENYDADSEIDPVCSGGIAAADICK